LNNLRNKTSCPFCVNKIDMKKKKKAETKTIKAKKSPKSTTAHVD
jgi:hypothetical protein